MIARSVSVTAANGPAGAVLTGGSFTAVTVIWRGALPVLLLGLPSSTVKVTVRVAVLGLSLVLTYVTDRSAV